MNKKVISILSISQAEKILHQHLKSHDDIEKGVQEILSLGDKSVLINIASDDFNQHYWTNGSESFWISNSQRSQKNNLETQSLLSSAITACLALGYKIKDSIVIAKMYVNQHIRLSKTIDNTALISNTNWPENEVDLPYLTHQPLDHPPDKFTDCGTSPLGLYPVVDNIKWLRELLPLGVKTIQLRIKNKNGSELENEIKESIHLAKKYEATLFINDYWELAIQHGAYGVHLGQEDLNTADIKKIRLSGLRLGISTHSYYEVARAHALRPSYLACGPVFETKSKVVASAPQGISQLKRWRRTLHYPLVAIGGINIENINDVIATNVEGIAMISAITQATDPIAATKKILTLVNAHATHAR